MVPISDYTCYNDNMRKSMLDKIFFVDKIHDISAIVDFGCADGSMIEFIEEIFPQYKFFGYDFDHEMIRLAKEKKIRNSFFHFDFHDLISTMNTMGGKKVVVCNSLIHEVYAYSRSMDDIHKFWYQIFAGHFDYVVIRDMFIEHSTRGMRTNKNWIANIRDHAPSKENLEEFESIWGGIGRMENALHYLMKYNYEANWDREVRENYFPLRFDDLKLWFPENFKVIYQDEYILPYTRDKVKEDFGIDLSGFKTHGKYILKLIK